MLAHSPHRARTCGLHWDDYWPRAHVTPMKSRGSLLEFVFNILLGNLYVVDKHQPRICNNLSNRVPILIMQHPDVLYENDRPPILAPPNMPRINISRSLLLSVFSRLRFSILVRIGMSCGLYRSALGVGKSLTLERLGMDFWHNTDGCMTGSDHLETLEHY